MMRYEETRRERFYRRTRSTLARVEHLRVSMVLLAVVVTTFFLTVVIGVE